MESLSPSGGMLVGDFHVAWSVTQVSLQANAVQGMLFTAGLAFLVLLLSTCNWLLSLYAMLGVVGVISSVFLVVNLLGWEFGIPEALALIVIIGFSVDYVLHIGTHYVSANSRATATPKVVTPPPSTLTAISPRASCVLAFLVSPTADT